MATNKIQEFINGYSEGKEVFEVYERDMLFDLPLLFRSLYEEIMKENPSHTDIRGNAPIPRSHIRRTFESFGVNIGENEKNIEQSCGSCKHLKSRSDSGQVGVCVAPYPVWINITEQAGNAIMKFDLGQTCRVFEPIPIPGDKQ